MMKTKINILMVALLFVLIPLNIIGQELIWYEFELGNIKIDFPTREVYQLDTIVKDRKIIQLSAKIGDSQFTLQKLLVNTENKISSPLPYDYESLIRFYDGVLDGVKEKSKAKNVQKEKIKQGNLIGYKSLVYNNIKKPLIELRTFLVDKKLIIISIYNPEIKSNKIKDKFFNSVNFDGLTSLEQYSINSNFYKFGYMFGKLFFYTALGAGLILLVYSTVLRKK